MKPKSKKMKYNIAESIKSYLVEIGMEQEELARLTGYSKGAMAQILQGNDMSVETARKISVAVGYNFIQEVPYMYFTCRIEAVNFHAILR